MGLFDKLRGELIDIIEWLDDSHHTLVWRFPRYNNEIKNRAQLIVRPGQKAIFVNQGQVADVFPPGQYELTTENLPILSTLRGWKHGFDSPFKCEVYFVSTRQITDLKWGTPNPILLRDADFGPIRLRAFGTYALRAIDPEILLRELVGTNQEFNSDDLTQLMRALIAEAFADMLGEAKIAALDLAANYRELSGRLRQMVCERIDDEYGLEVPALFIGNVSLPPEVEKALDARGSMAAVGDLGRYQQYQMANALGAMANNPAGGVASEGMGLGMGFAMAQQFAQAAGGGMAPGAQAAPSPAPGAPPPPPSAQMFHVTKAGQTFGPLPLAQIVQQIGQGQIDATTLLWSPGMSGWVPASQVPAVAAYLGGPPPPPPPPPPPQG